MKIATGVWLVGIQNIVENGGRANSITPHGPTGVECRQGSILLHEE